MKTVRNIFTKAQKDKDEQPPSRIPTLNRNKNGSVNHSKSGSDINKIGQDEFSLISRSQPSLHIEYQSETLPHKPCLKPPSSQSHSHAPRAMSQPHSHVPRLMSQSRGRSSYPLTKIPSLNFAMMESSAERASSKIRRSRSLHENKNRTCHLNKNNSNSGVKRSGSANRLCHKQPADMPRKSYNAVMRPRRQSSNEKDDQRSTNDDNSSYKENSVQGTPSDISSPKVAAKLDFDSISISALTPFIQPQKTGIPDDFEEMEALLMERDQLESELESERRQRTVLERSKLEHEEKQQKMLDQIKSLEAEIIKVDGDMVTLRSRAEDADKLADQKRALEARLIAARGMKREMDTISICSVDDDLISLSGMSLYSENGLMLNEDIHQLSKTELVQNLIAVKKEKKELEANLKQLRCDMVNEKRRHDKTVKDLMGQLRGIHMPVRSPLSSTEPDIPSLDQVEYERQLTEMRSVIESLETQKKSQTKLVERLIGERNHHLIELARLRGDGEEATQLREEVSKLRRQNSEKDSIILTKLTPLPNTERRTLI